VQQEADDIEVRLRKADDAIWAEVGGAKEGIQIPRRFQRGRDDSSVASTVQGNRLVTEPCRGGRCAGLGPFEYETANDGRVAVFREVVSARYGGSVATSSRPRLSLRRNAPAG